jgi:hypothetical protein
MRYCKYIDCLEKTKIYGILFEYMMSDTHPNSYN